MHHESYDLTGIKAVLKYRNPEPIIYISFQKELCI